MNVSWTRDAENDIETIRFGADGDFTYYCSCGNPVNDSDLCESYTYNDETKEIKFECFETTEEMENGVRLHTTKLSATLEETFVFPEPAPAFPP